MRAAQNNNLVIHKVLQGIVSLVDHGVEVEDEVEDQVETGAVVLSGMTCWKA